MKTVDFNEINIKDVLLTSKENNDTDIIINKTTARKTIQETTIDERNTSESISSEEKKTDIFSAMIIISELSMGIGLLALPQAFSYMSFTFGIIFTLLFGISTYFTLNMMCYVANEYKIYEYSTLIRIILGTKIDKLYNYSLICSCFLSITAYLNIGNYFLLILILFDFIEIFLVSDLIGHAIYEFFYVNNPNYKTCEDFVDNGYWSNLTTRMLVIYGYTFLCLVPFCLKKQIGDLALISYVGMGAFFYLITVSYL